MNIVGDYRLSTSTNTLRWAVTNVVGTYGGTATVNQTEADYGAYQLKNTAGINTYQVVAQPWAGNVGSACFTMSIDLETSNGIEISGLNAGIYYFTITLTYL